MQAPMEVIINGELVTVAEVVRRHAENKHVMRTFTASLDPDIMLGTIGCDECSRLMQVPLHENGNWEFSGMEVLDKGDPFASHSYCSSGDCPTFDISISQG